MSLSLSLPIEPSGFGGVFYDEGGMFERDVLPSSCKLVGILGHVGLVSYRQCRLCHCCRGWVVCQVLSVELVVVGVL